MKIKIKKIFFKYWRALLVGALCLFFFLGASFYNYFSQQDGVNWSSPDENANYVFTKLYAQSGQLSVFEKYNLIAEDIIHPRSFKSEHGELKPVSFLGIILLYGSIAQIVGYKIIPYLTPFFAAISIFYFYLLIKKIFGKNSALISAVLLAFFPPFFYFSAKGMFHNVIFVSLLVIGLYYSTKMASVAKIITYKHFLPAAAAGFFIGLSVAMRSSELLWLAPALFLAWIFYAKKIGLSRIIIFLSFSFLAFLPILYWNQVLYAFPTNTGYPEMNQALSSIAGAVIRLGRAILTGDFSHAKDLFFQIKDGIFHFGFQPYHAAKMVYYYFATMFTWLFGGAILGGLWLVKKNWRKKRLWAFLLPYFLASAILIFYYGSWVFYDNPDPESFTIGNSYTRYWLPVYLGALPLASYFLICFTSLVFKKNKNSAQPEDAKEKFFFSRKFFIISARVFILLVIIIYSIHFVLLGSTEGLYFTALKQRGAMLEKNQVLELTEPNALIITKYHDKLFFPDRKVTVTNLFSEEKINSIYAELARFLPVYHYNFTFSEKDLEYLNFSKLPVFGLRLEEVALVADNFTLYRLKIAPDPFLSEVE